MAQIAERPDLPKEVRMAIRDAYVDSTLEMVMKAGLSEKFEVLVKKNFPTAAWKYIAPRHRLIIGDRIFEKLVDFTPERARKYARAFFIHEHGHLLSTDRDLKAASLKLKRLKIPFQLWNLFEDARIEHKQRQVLETTFDWLDFETLEQTDRPLGAMFTMIQCEGDLAKAEPMITRPGLFDQVRPFYERALGVRNLDEMIPVMLDFLVQFKDEAIPPSDSSFGSGKGKKSEEGEEGEGSALGDLTNDLSVVLELTEDDLEGAVSLDDWAGHGYSDKEDIPENLGEAKDKPASGEIGQTNEDPPFEGSADILGMLKAEGHMGTHDFAESALEISRVLEKVMVGAARVIPTDEPTRRIYRRSMASEDIRYARKAVKGRARRKVELVLDLSGSMSGCPSRGARAVIAALSILARKGLVEGAVTLSVGLGKAMWQRVPLPVAPKNIALLEGFGGFEGLQFAIEGVERHLRAADVCGVYTDGCITDKPLNKAKLHAKGIRPCGLYVGEISSLDQMQTYFTEVIVRSDANALAHAMAQRYMRKR